MVNASKLKFFKTRLEQIEKQKLDEIKTRYPEIKVEYRDLVAAGKGIMKSEAEIRAAIGNISRYSCPPVIEVLEIFTFNGERTKAKAENEAQEAKRAQEIASLRAKTKVAMDLVYFGTDEQLLQALHDMEAI